MTCKAEGCYMETLSNSSYCSDYCRRKPKRCPSCFEGMGKKSDLCVVCYRIEQRKGGQNVTSCTER